MMRSRHSVRHARLAIPAGLAMLVLALLPGCDSDDHMRAVRLLGTVHPNLTCWVLETAGDTYELQGLPQEFRQEGLVVTVRGVIRDDVASVCQIGPIVQVWKVEPVVP